MQNRPNPFFEMQWRDGREDLLQRPGQLNTRTKISLHVSRSWGSTTRPKNYTRVPLKATRHFLAPKTNTGSSTSRATSQSCTKPGESSTRRLLTFGGGDGMAGKER